MAGRKDFLEEEGLTRGLKNKRFEKQAGQGGACLGSEYMGKGKGS